MDKVSGFGQLNIIDSKMMQGITANMQEGVDASAEAESLTSQIVSSTDTVNFSQASKSMMAGNFVSSGSVEDHQSKYVKGRQAGNDAVLMQANRQDALLNVAIAEADAAKTYAERILAGKRAERRMKEEMQQASMEASRRNLDEQNKSVEENAAKAVEGTSEEGATQGEAAVSSEVQSAPVTSAASPQETVAAAGQAGSVMMEVAAPVNVAPAVSAPSVDIVV